MRSSRILCCWLMLFALLLSIESAASVITQPPLAPCTLISSNFACPGSLTSGVGTGVAGTLDLGQGTLPGTFPLNTFSLYAPTAIATSYQWVAPASDAAGVIASSGAGTPGVLSIIPLSGSGSIARASLTPLTSRVSTQFDKTTDTALANVTGLSLTVTAGTTYQFRATLNVTGDIVGGQKYAIAGTATATAIIYNIVTISNTANTIVISSRQTALAGSAGQAGATSDFTTIEGLITVNAGGTLTVQFAQNASSGTSSVLVGSNFTVQAIP